jgi:outer membrane protein assembly factor BamB
MPLRFSLLLFLCPALLPAAEVGSAAVPGESRPAATRLGEARRHLAAKQYSDGITLLISLIDSGGNDLVVLPDSGHGVQARLLAQRELARLPAEGLAVYRKRVEAQARRLLDEGALDRVVDEYFCSKAALAALDRLGDQAFERGRFAEAESWWRLVAPLEEPEEVSLVFPDPPAAVAARARAKQLLARLFAGRSGFGRDLARFRTRHGKAAGRLAGRDGAYADILEALAKERRARPAPEAGDWTTFAGAPSRNRVVPFGPRLLDHIARLGQSGPIWHFDLARRTRQEEAPAPLPTARKAQVQAARRLAFHPVVVGDLALVADARHITAYNLVTGRASTWYDLEDQVGGVRASLSLPAPPDLRYTLTVAGDNLFARMGCQSIRDVRPDPRTGRPAPGGESVLVSLSLKASPRGRQRWLVRAIDPGRKDFSVFEGAPLVSGGRVFIAATRFEGDKVVTAIRCYPANPEDSSPLPLWRTDVCETRELLPAGSGNPNMQQRFRQHLLTEAGSRIVYCSHSGAVVALDARTGRRAWALRYPRRDSREPEDEPALRELCPCVFARGKVYVAPADSDLLYCLDPQTGAVVWKRERLDVVHLLGVGQGRLIFTTWRNEQQGNLYTGGLRAVSADDGGDKGGWQEPGGGGGLVPFGRGLLIGDLVLWPTPPPPPREDRRQDHPLGVVYAFRQTDGVQPDNPTVLHRIPAGNLVFANGSLLVTNGTTLSAFVPTEKLPDDDPRATLGPRELLRGARSAARRARHDLALARYDAVLKRPDAGRRFRAEARRERQAVQFAVAERARPDEAARLFQQAAQGSAAARLDALVHAALHWTKAGDGGRAVRAWQAVLRRGDDSVEDAAGRPQRAARIALLQMEKLLAREDALAEAQRQAKALLAGKGEKALDRLAREAIFAPAARAALADEARAAAKARRWERSAWWWGWLAGTLPPGKARVEALSGLAAAWEEMGCPHAARIARQASGAPQGRAADFHLPLLAQLDLPLPPGERFLAPPAREGPGADRLWSWSRRGDRRPHAPREGADVSRSETTTISGELVCRDRASGEVRWRSPLPFEPAWLEVLGHLVVAAGPRGAATLDGNTGGRFWNFSVPPRRLYPASPLAVVRVPRDTRPGGPFGDFHLAGDRLLLTQGGRSLLALDVLSGAVLWQRHAPGAELDLPAPSGRIQHIVPCQSGRLLVGVSGQGLFLDGGSGRTVHAWRNDVTAWLRRPVALPDGGVLISQSDRVVCLDPRAAKPSRWVWLPPGKTTRTGQPPLLVAGAGRLVAVVPENLGARLARLDVETGKPLWRGQPLVHVNDTEPESWLIDAGGRTLYHAEGRRLWAWSLEDGKLAWRRDLPEEAAWRLRQAGDTLLAWPRRCNGLAFRLRWLTGSLQWRMGPWPGEQAVVPVLCLDARSGELVQRLNLPLERLAGRVEPLDGASLLPALDGVQVRGAVPGPVLWFDGRGLVLGLDRLVRCVDVGPVRSSPRE